MMELARPEEPDFLRENSEKWGQDYAAKKASNPKYEFRWKQHNLRSTRELVVDALESMSHYHCCYCDGGYPLNSSARNTVDHFRPKSLPRFYHLVYSWSNLFLACDICQGHKSDNFDELLLKPDDVLYRFETYFVINHKSGKIEVNPRASLLEQQRAELTISTFGLNEGMRPHHRLIEYEHFRDALLGNPQTNIDTFNFRFFLR